jgi:hypothetical protein
MLFYAANPSAIPHPALSSAVQANNLPPTGGHGGEMPSFSTAPGQTNEAAMLADLRGQEAEYDFGPACVSRFVSRPLLGHCFGAHPAPGGTRSSALPAAPVPGLGSSQNKFVSRGTEHRTNFFRAPPRKQTFGTWEPGPLARLRPV